MLPWLLLLWGCPASPDRPVEPGSWFELRIGERAIGSGWTGERSSGGARHVWMGQRYRWVLDGSPVDIEVDSRGILDPGGRVVRFDRWRSGVRSQWSGEPAWWLDQAAWEGTLPEGVIQALDPAGLRVEPILVERRGDRIGWTQGGVATTVGPSDQRWGVFQRVPVDAEPALEPVDPVALLRRRADPVAGARGAHRATWSVGGELREQVVPIPIEIPSATLADLERLVRVVQRRLDHVPSPGTPDALEALRAGRGDCNEFAEVFVALAHENGLAARPVAGLVYTEGDLGPGLDLHAWAEVELPSLGWVAVDPALGQAIADAAHLRLAVDADAAAAVVVVASETPIALVAVR